MTSTKGIRAAVGHYATILFLRNGDLAIVAGGNLMEEWLDFKRTGYDAMSREETPEDERTPRNLTLSTLNQKLTLETLLYDLGSREGNDGPIDVLSEHDLADIGALTSGPVLATDIERDDDYRIIRTGDLWWFQQYAVEDELETLLNEGIVVISKAPE